MFLSNHDFGVLLLVCAVAGAVGVLTAVALARVVVAGSRALGVSAASLGEGAYLPARGSLPQELAAVDRQLAEVSARLEASRSRERALEDSRRELVAWVSHDLRTPLAGIRAMAEALEDGVVEDQISIDRYHAGIRREADRLAVMVDDLFELSRINASALSLTLQEISLADLVSDAVASASPVAAAKGVRLVGGTSEDLPLVEGSVPELGRVLRNLLSNAIRHTPTDGVVSVVAGADELSAYVEVADACGGIPAEDLPRVFDVAFRGTAARTPGIDGGAGLGLAIARGLVEAHHGEITIHNDGPGCRVRVRLPVQLSDLAPA
jgi:signal transduction histidine kinase